MAERKQVWFFHYIGPEYEHAQCEIAGLCLRIGSRAWVFGRLDYRDRDCPWPLWARVHLVLGQRPHRDPAVSRRWKLFAFGRPVFDLGGNPCS